MRIKRLELRAFGPFTNHTIAFAGSGPALHIVYGPNEAGKSSALRGLKALLYGFPERTADNFKHPSDQLLLAGCLSDGSGGEIDFLRRKKRKADILTPEGTPLDPALLAPFLHGIDSTLFESLYGIDHQRLIEGGEEILAQRGEAGQAIFAAGAGISKLTAILANLDREASEIFKPRGARQLLNQALSRCDDLRRTVRAASLPVRQWQDHEQRRRDALRLREELEKERALEYARLKGLERLEQAIPNLSLLANLKARLVAFASSLTLSPDFESRFAQTGLEIREATVCLETDERRRADLARQLGSLHPDPATLAHADAIEALYEGLGQYRKGKKDREGLAGRYSETRKEADALFQEVRPGLSLGEAQSLRPLLARKKQLTALAARYEAVTGTLSQLQRQVRDNENELAGLRETLAGLPSPPAMDGLKEALRRGRELGAIDQEITKECQALAENNKIRGRELSRLGLWQGTLMQLPGLALPLSSTVEKFATLAASLDEESRQLATEEKKTTAELGLVRTEIKTMAYGQIPPTEAELFTARAKRDAGWQLIRRTWLGGVDVSAESRDYDAELPLAEAFERCGLQADVAADRLRREADRAAQAAGLQARGEGLAAALIALAAKKKDNDNRCADFEKAWQQTWALLDIAPRSPKEMLQWLTAMEKLSFLTAEAEKRQLALDEKIRQRAQARALVAKEFVGSGDASPPEGAPLADLLLDAERVVADAARIETQRQQLLTLVHKAEKTLQTTRQDRIEAQEALVSWEGQWQAAIVEFAAGAVEPPVVIDRLELLSGCFAKLKESEEFARRISGIDRDSAAYEREVGELVTMVAADLVKIGVEEKVARLQSRLSATRRDSALALKASEEEAVLVATITATRARLDLAQRERTELLHQAGCVSAEELAVVLEKHNQRKKIEEKIADLSENLVRIAEGRSIDELAREAAETDPDALPALIRASSQRIEEDLNPRINTLSQEIGEQTKELERMDGSAGAAEAAEAMARELAVVDSLTRHYLLLRFGAQLLRDEIERYRREHQDPVLRLASAYFQDLTIGSFTGLLADVGDHGEPVLVGLRPDGARVAVTTMSSGARDQLYLALRLATIEWRHGSAKPMPFVADDILINFDDRRSQAAIAALARLARTTQVILFTHHQQVALLPPDHDSVGTIYLHDLSAIGGESIASLPSGSESVSEPSASV